MDHHGSGIRRRGGLDPTQEGQQAGGVVGHAVLGPRGEVELTNLVFGRVTSLDQTKHTAGSATVLCVFKASLLSFPLV